MTISEKAKAELVLLEKEAERLKSLYSSLPKGRLECYRNENSFKCFQCFPSPGSKKNKIRHYIPRKDRVLASALAAKGFIEDRLASIDRQSRTLNAFLRNYSPSALTEQFNELSPFRQELVSSFLAKERRGDFLANELDSWSSAAYKKSRLHPEHLIVDAGEGLLVRSKSEAYIVSALRAYGIPFRYEEELIYEDQIYSPDFTIRHPQTGEFYLWEHFGRIDLAGYLESMLVKIRVYKDCGFYPGKNFIMTFECAEAPLSFGLVDTLINHYFL